MTTDRPAGRMRPADALAWNLGRDPVLRAMMVGVVRLERAPSWTVLRERVERLTHSEPRLRQVVRTVPLHRTPIWRVDPAFDLDYHLRRAGTPPGDAWRHVLHLVDTEMMEDFDRTRPLWRFTLVEGLPDGEAALVCTLHHALADGIGALALAAAVVDPARSRVVPEPRPPRASSLPADLMAASRDEVEFLRSLAVDVGRRAPGATVRALRHPWRTTAGAVALAGSVVRVVAPIGHAASAGFGGRRSRRVVDTLTVSQAGLAASARIAGVHLGDAFLAAVIDGVHRYHEAVGASLGTVRVTVPVSQRNRSDDAASNRITLLRMQFPARIDDPERRMRRIWTITRRWRREPALEWTDAIAAGLGLLPRAYLAQVFRRVEVVASNVPGPAAAMSLDGVRVTAVFPFGPTLGSAANVTLLTYAGRCHVGVVVDPDAVSEPDLLVTCLRDAFDDVLAVGRARTARPATERAVVR